MRAVEALKSIQDIITEAGEDVDLLIENEDGFLFQTIEDVYHGKNDDGEHAVIITIGSY